jgi:putative heme-binding domain-containing protein
MKSLEFVLLIVRLAWLAVPAKAQPNPLVEVVPLRQRTTWRYTLTQPSDTWTRPTFDDTTWKQGRGGFGSPGTPAVVIGTRWDTDDIWLRREVMLPTDPKALENLQLLVFHDEDVEIYLNGVLAAREPGFGRDYEPIELLPEAARLIQPGAKLLIAVHCHQTTGGQGIDVGLARVPPGYADAQFLARRKDRYRAFAMSHEGNASAGRALFQDERRLACSRCHATDGKSATAGPDLVTAGDKFPRIELIESILNPSATIAVGYSTTIVSTRSGETFDGIVKDATPDQLTLMGADGRAIHIPTRDVRSQRTSNISMMPEGLETSLSPQEFTDVIEYLSTLRLPDSAAANRQGMPAHISELAKPVALIPIHPEDQHFDHPCWIGQIPGQAGVFLIAEHETGKAWLLDTTGDKPTKALWGDFGTEVRKGGATGLLGIAFHPHFRENRKYYIQHELEVDGRLHARVSEKLAAPDLRRDSGTPSRPIISFACTTDVHSGGGIEFGPDGYLYVAMGDTGPQGDPQGHGQDLRLPLGKMMRIDVDHEAEGRAYTIPTDNPFVARPGVPPRNLGLRLPRALALHLRPRHRRPLGRRRRPGPHRRSRHRPPRRKLRVERLRRLRPLLQPLSPRRRILHPARLRLHPPPGQFHHRRLRLPPARILPLRRPLRLRRLQLQAHLGPAPIRPQAHRHLAARHRPPAHRLVWS